METNTTPTPEKKKNYGAILLTLGLIFGVVYFGCNRIHDLISGKSSTDTTKVVAVDSAKVVVDTTNKVIVTDTVKAVVDSTKKTEIKK